MAEDAGAKRIRLRELFAPAAADLPPGQRAVEAFPAFGMHFWTRPSVGEARIDVVVPGRTWTFGWAALAALPRREQVSDFHCVAGWSHRGLRWEGVAMRDLWDAAFLESALPGASHLLFVGADGFAAALRLEDALTDGVLVADRLDGEPLDGDHGAPLRLVAPAHYGYKSVKYLCRLELHLGEPDDRPLPRRSQLPFRIVRPHPRARVAYRERHRRLPARAVELVYRLLVPLFARLSRARNRRPTTP